MPVHACMHTCIPGTDYGIELCSHYIVEEDITLPSTTDLLSSITNASTQETVHHATPSISTTTSSSEEHATTLLTKPTSLHISTTTAFAHPRQTITPSTTSTNTRMIMSESVLTSIVDVTTTTPATSSEIDITIGML